MRVFPNSISKRALALMLALLLPCAHATNYTLIDLGTLGGSYSFAYGINNQNQVVGVSQTAGNTAAHATLWDVNGAHDLGTLGGTVSIAYAINNGGQAVGVSYTSGNIETHATAWVNGTPMVGIVDLGGISTSGIAYAINDSGLAAGNNRVLGSSTPAATVWNGAASLSLGVLPGGTFGYANGINNSGWVIGNSDASGQPAHAMLWTGSTPTDLGTLGGSQSFAKAINNAGQVVGASYLPGDTYAHGTFWSTQGIVDLGTLPGGTYSIAYGLNNRGQAVGDSYSANGPRHTILWNGLNTVDLNDYLSGALKNQGWIVDVAQNINDNGWIIGGVFNSVTGQEHAFLMIPSTP